MIRSCVGPTPPLEPVSREVTGDAANLQRRITMSTASDYRHRRGDSAREESRTSKK